MTAFTTLSSASLAVGKPLTSTIALAMRDNPIAIAEADASVALSLLPTVLLGTLTTTSGATQTLSGLTLTPFRFLRMTFNGVSLSGTGWFQFGSGGVRTIATAAAAETISGMAEVDLGNGVGVASTSNVTNGGVVYAATTGFTTATTSIAFTTSAGTFDAGSIRIYGVK